MGQFWEGFFMVTSSVVRMALVEFFGSAALWRWQKAEEHPEDARNFGASEALGRLAIFVSGLPDDDELLTAFAAIPVVFDEGFFEAPRANLDDGRSISGHEASRYGFYGEEEPRQWLASWLQTVREKAESQATALATEVAR